MTPSVPAFGGTPPPNTQVITGLISSNVPADLGEAGWGSGSCLHRKLNARDPASNAGEKELERESSTCG